MTQPLIITAAVVGAEVMREHTPYVPYTPEEIAEEARKCRDAGACMAHVHGRLEDGTPTQDIETFGQILTKIRERSDILVQFSTGGAVGMTVAERVEAVELRPDMATLTTGTVNFGDDVFLNSWPMVQEIAAKLQEHGVRPEIEVFDTGMVDAAARLLKMGLVEGPLHYDFVLGVPGGMGARRENLEFLVSMLPEGSTWTVAGIGRHQLALAKIAIELGGHVRVGLEDNVYLSKGVLAQGNAPLVEAVVTMAQEVGRSIASIPEARALLRT